MVLQPFASPGCSLPLASLLDMGAGREGPPLPAAQGKPRCRKPLQNQVREQTLHRPAGALSREFTVESQADRPARLLQHQRCLLSLPLGAGVLKGQEAVPRPIPATGSGPGTRCCSTRPFGPRVWSHCEAWTYGVTCAVS